MGIAESVKGASDIYCPLDGVVSEINLPVVEKPSIINKDPYGKGITLFLEQKTTLGRLALQGFRQ